MPQCHIGLYLALPAILLFAGAASSAEAQLPGEAGEVPIEVRSNETWLPMVPAHDLDRRCPHGAPGSCRIGQGLVGIPLEHDPEPAELLLLRNPWRLGFRVEAGWDRLEIGSFSHPALDPIRIELGGEPLDDFTPEMTWRPGSRWVACLERGSAAEPELRSCHRFGSAPLEWGEPFVEEVRTAEPPTGAPTAAILLDEEWVELPRTTATRNSGHMISVFNRDSDLADHPARLLLPAPGEEPFRLRLAAGWNEVRITRALTPEHWEDVAGPGYRARSERLPLAPRAAHELRFPREGTPGERWSVCLQHGSVETTLRQECFTLGFAPEEG